MPATLSPDALDILRKDMGFEGVIMTDCLEMDGIRATYGTVEGVAMAFKAGVDNVMVCHTYDVQTASVDRVCSALESGELTNERVDSALARLAKLKKQYTNWDDAMQTRTDAELDALNEKSLTLAKRVYSDLATVVKAEDGFLPLSKDAKTVFLSPGKNVPAGGAVDSGVEVVEPTRVPWTKATFGDTLRKYNPGVEDIRFTESGLDNDQWRKVEEAEIVVLATRNAKESPYQTELAMELVRRRGSKKLASVATCNPYDFLDVSKIETNLAVYEPTVEAFAAAVDILYGAAEARGSLPVTHKVQ